MPDSPVRVALLARPGEVRDQLRRALADFGAQLVAEGDPAELDPRTVADGRPGIVVVSLEPAIEDALERFELLLGSPDVEVIYDDAEVTRLLDGWDLARWARHLAAKLAGADGVLPPAPGGLDHLPEFDIALEPGAPPTPAQQMDAEKLEDYAAESLDLSAWVPTTPLLTDVVVDTDGADAPQAGGEDAALELDLDLSVLEQAMAPRDEPVADDMAPPADAADSSLGLHDADTLSEFNAAHFVDAQADADASLDLDDELTLETASASTDAPLERADAGGDAPFDFETAGSTLTLGDSDAPLELSDTETPLELADADADLPLELIDAGSDAPFDFETAGSTLELTDSEAPLELADAGTDAPLASAARGDAAEPTDLAELGDLDLGSMDSLDLGLEGDLPMLEIAEAAEAPATDEPLLLDMEIGDGPVKFSNFTDDDDGTSHDAGVDDDVAALAAQLDAFEATDQRQAAREPDFASLVETPPAAAERRPPPAPAAASASASAKPAAASSVFASLELVPMDADIAKMAAADTETPPSPSLAGGNGNGHRSSLSLAAEGAVANNHTVAGALFVIAGLGGPDGVRQLLSLLPPTLPVPVLLYQHLDTGKHERLVGQLAKASRLPLDLATEGKLAFAGRVAVLQPGIGIARREESIEFVRNGGLSAVVAAMPAKESIVLVLSGADPTVVPSVLALGSAGGMMLAQEPGSCFDPAAPQAVIAAGAYSAPLNELAQKIVERWT